MPPILGFFAFFWGLFAIAATATMIWNGLPARFWTLSSLAQIIVFIYAPPALIAYGYWREHKKTRALRSEMLKAAGLSEGARFVFFAEFSGIAINTDDRTFTLMHDGFCRTCPFSAFRAYRTWFQPTGNSLRGHAGVSGLFLTVQSDERPEWRIRMYYQADQSRWEQIISMQIIDVAEAA